ncbi:hypothetical protein [Flavobacterium sp. I3-2]|uniref:hypothetical protein n=1 Tax=Flavobacterium sp. I3-2 TaxID=2748319 RepID=UPI0015B227F9|nr:hypothetical protein [Flavobacterium sp. I3-2]
MFRYYSVIGFFLILSCQTKSQDLNVLFSFPKKNNEISGLVYHPSDHLLYALEDKGNANEIYAFDLNGKLTKTISINNVTNTDWEDFTIDTQGNLYIGNFGNNDNSRQDLAIYKLNFSDLNNKTITPSQITHFAYPEQTEFPPKKKELFFDCEAFVEIDSSFYLFTKNRSKGFDGSFYVYKIPNKAGNFKAQKIAELNSGNSYDRMAITGAAYHPESKQIALTTHTNVILIPFENEGSFQQDNLKFVAYNHNSQKESLTFKDKNTLFIADEKEKKKDNGRNVYEFKLLD